MTQFHPLLLLLSSATALQSWVDPETPASARSTVGMDGRALSLVFSDEFEDVGRVFQDGADTRWTSEDRPGTTNEGLHYYNSSHVKTSAGKLVIETAREDVTYEEHDPNGFLQTFQRDYVSGMVSTWNKFCFTSGMIEISFQLPGDPQRGGLWPAFWVSFLQLLFTLTVNSHTSSSDAWKSGTS